MFRPPFMIEFVGATIMLLLFAKVETTDVAVIVVEPEAGCMVATGCKQDNDDDDVATAVVVEAATRGGTLVAAPLVITN